VPRAVKWFTTMFTDQAIASAGILPITLLDAVDQANMKGSTVTRMIIDIWGQADVLSARKRLDIGIIWIDTDAVIASALPDPEVESERADWLFRGTEFYVGTSSTPANARMWPRSWDIRSQRKCTSDLDQLMLIAKVNAITSGGILFSGTVRVLLRLP